jgi:general secretion pathway protein H
MGLTISPGEKDMMLTLQTGIYKKISRSRIRISRSGSLNIFCFRCPVRSIRKTGFTLIELIVVLFIISFALIFIMPSFWQTDEHSLKTEARHISSTLRYIYDEAVSKKTSYLVNFNLKEKSWSYKSKQETRQFRIKENVELIDIIVPSRGEISTGELILEFGPMGLQEPLLLHLRKGESEYTILLNHLNGRTKIVKGYRLSI